MAPDAERVGRPPRVAGAEVMIDEYRAGSFLDQRAYRLYENRLFLSVNRRFGSIHEQSIELTDLRPEFSRSWVRSGFFESAVAWLVLLGLLGLVVFLNTRSPDTFDPESLARGIWATVGIVVLVIIAYVVFPRRIEVVVFKNASGSPFLAIARRGPQLNHFEEFVESLTRQIVRATSRW